MHATERGTVTIGSDMKYLFQPLFAFLQMSSLLYTPPTLSGKGLPAGIRGYQVLGLSTLLYHFHGENVRKCSTKYTKQYRMLLC